MANAFVELRLKKGADRRTRMGHPWIFSNELQSIPKNLDAGSPVIVSDVKGEVLCSGYFNARSLIAVRKLQDSPEAISNPWNQIGFFKDRFLRAWNLRVQLGLTESSFRWVFAEADRLPGLVIDRYLLESQKQVFVAQILTAGMEHSQNLWVEALKEFVRDQNLESTLILQKRSSFRELEGLKNLEPEVMVLKGATQESHLHEANIMMSLGEGKSKAIFTVDLLKGQKTGFFMDQRSNVASLVELLSSNQFEGKTITILDLCSYVGQWGVFLSLHFQGQRAQVTAMDDSQSALTFAKLNVERAGADFEGVNCDVLKDWEPQLKNRKFDIVICDPPAFVKSAKVLPQAKQAYARLNEMALSRLKPGGWFVSSSCSYHLHDYDFEEVLVRAQSRARKSLTWFYRGGQAMDHPIKMEFPEGRYLKAWIGKDVQ